MVKLLCFSAASQLCLARLALKIESTAFFAHLGQPFTQGLDAKSECVDTTGQLLEDCLLREDDRATCFEGVLNKCLTLYESSGGYGDSYIQVLTNFSSSRPSIQTRLPASVFAEGLTVLDDGSVLVGTWKEHRLLKVKQRGNNFAYVDEYQLTRPAEIWGLTHNSTHLFMTSGDIYLYIFKLPLETGRKKTGTSLLDSRRRPVFEIDYDSRIPIKYTTRDGALKELRWVNEIAWNDWKHKIYGNVWQTDHLYEIDPITGVVTDGLNLQKPEHPDETSVFKFKDRPKSPSRRSRYIDMDKVWNGITFLSADWAIFTGKLFEHVYLSKLHTL
eukprot:Blabericola_migrator_1__2937@NODE_1846_length_3682_cov_166_922268_g534_i1_p1_GENE_NODE_1846_length_3682_cov_166_922268_g534_i1NODE_1846_length_3682_cov_166_922268_g534_i1_p1_ORF_typecomplete_len330_score59_03Glu_cyclase_2/PF05096_12/4_3e34_NODE_1846_length_3682_cov_166_922268_g534_i124063395